jgi:hypothetical protein
LGIVEKQMSEHPALGVVLWTSDEKTGFRIERASYKGHALLVRHTGDWAMKQVCVGYVDGRHIATRPNMPQICEALFAVVDGISK